ncbi:MAG: prepilin peptidase [Candidatus Cloacimonetes bacterium]|nr:prepilin peptidase [Candidatus Cloacimonadota bacterium]
MNSYDLPLAIVIAVLGAAFGSFFNVLVYRIPRKESIIFPGSHCPACNRKIPPWLNIPIFSWILLGGKCKYCKTAIHWHYLILEILTPLVFLGVFMVYGSENLFLVLKYCLFFGFGLVILFIDFFERIIPDVISLPLILTGIVFSFFPANDITWKLSLLGGVITFGFFYLIGLWYLLTRKKEGMGGGDIKYIAAIGTFFGPINSLFIIIVACAVALVIMIPLLRFKKEYFPFGPFLVIASYIVMFFHESMFSTITTLTY